MWRCFGCIVIIAALAAGRASAQDLAAQFYSGKQITVIVGSSAGGGYDIYARLVARHSPSTFPAIPSWW
jgi:tripartite-type tricarboxylate transporter receptor subunit TctC